MSRFRKFTHSLATGYLLLVVTVFQTLASVPLALHYLSQEEFGLWALVLQVAGYLALIDMGMSISISRFLIDHKDDPGTGVYGSILKTGTVVLAIQGAIIVLGGLLLSLVAPALFAIPFPHARDFQWLVAGQCVALGLLFAGRVFTHMLQAHQRYDLCNFASIGSMLINLATLWAGFECGFGLYSLLVASFAAQVATTLFTGAAAWRLRLFPPPNARGHFSRATFNELFGYSRQIFLITIGMQLVNASQVIIISRTLGLNAAAVWSIATKTFMLAQQVVNRPLDFATAGFSEMIVRGERDRVFSRFRDLVVVSASLAVWAGLAVAICNDGFLFFWTKGRIHWSVSSDWLMAALLIVNSTTRCYVGLTAMTKDIRNMQFVYIAEGTIFVTLSFLVSARLGMNGIIGAAILSNILCSGIYGLHRVRQYFNTSVSNLLAWLRSPLYCLVAQTILFGLVAFLTGALSPAARLSVNAAVAGFAGFLLFWQLGLTRPLRTEAAALLNRWR